MGRRKHSSDFKKKVALEAIRERKTINQIAKEFQLHPVQVSEWKNPKKNLSQPGEPEVRFPYLMNSLKLDE